LTAAINLALSLYERLLVNDIFVSEMKRTFSLVLKVLAEKLQ